MDAFRLFLHVLAASVWVGGQIVVIALLPTARRLGDDAPRRLAVAFNRVAWPAFAVAVATGLWNLVLIPLDELAHPWIELKVLAVTLSGVGAAIHQFANGNRVLLAGGGAAASLFAVASMYLGFLSGPTG